MGLAHVKAFKAGPQYKGLQQVINNHRLFHKPSIFQTKIYLIYLAFISPHNPIEKKWVAFHCLKVYNKLYASAGIEVQI